MSFKGPTAHIMMVDDEADTLLLARRSLERAGYEVTTAQSVVLARAELTHRIPDLLIIDYSLSTIETGLEFFRSVREAGVPVPSILVTGFTNESRIIEALRAGVADVIPKTTGYLEYLPEAVERVLSTQRLQRKIAEAEQLQSREKFYRQIAEAIPHLVWTASPDGAYDYLSRQWLDYAGMPAHNQQGFNWLSDIVHPDDRSQTDQVAQAAIADNRDYDVEHRLRSQTGTYRWFRTRGQTLRDRTGPVVKWFGTCTDIEEQKQVQYQRESLLQRERLARAEAEHAARMKEEFVATLSHELRTPLNAIAGWAQLLRRDSCTDPETRKKGLEVIDRNARLQAQMVDDLLDMSRILAGNLRLEVQTIDLCEIIEAVKLTLQPAAEAKHIHITVHCDATNTKFQADSSRLQQIIWNLLTNAIKFTDAEGTVQMHVQQSQAELSLTVTDNGCGINAEFLPFVFDRFRQEDGSATRRVGGLGLGLSIVKQLTELHGGSIEAHSAGLGQGSQFTVRFPQHRQALNLKADAPAAVTAINLTNSNLATKNSAASGQKTDVPSALSMTHLA